MNSQGLEVFITTVRYEPSRRRSGHTSTTDHLLHNTVTLTPSHLRTVQYLPCNQATLTAVVALEHVNWKLNRDHSTINYTYFRIPIIIITSFIITCVSSCIGFNELNRFCSVLSHAAVNLRGHYHPRPSCCENSTPAYPAAIYAPYILLIKWPWILQYIHQPRLKTWPTELDLFTYRQCHDWWWNGELIDLAQILTEKKTI